MLLRRLAFPCRYSDMIPRFGGSKQEICLIVYTVLFFSELCWGKAMVAYTKPQQRKIEESEWLKGERDQIKFIDLGFERWQVVRCWKARRQDVP